MACRHSCSGALPRRASAAAPRRTGGTSYVLTRLRLGGWGVIGGVLLSALVFELSHGHFYQSDPVVLLLFLSGFSAAICWAHATVQTGSVVPAIVAHGLGNVPEPATPPGLGVMVTGMALVVAARRTSIAARLRAFASDWSNTPHKWHLGLALLATAGVMTAAALYRPLLPALGGFALLVVLVLARPPRTTPR